MPHPERPHLKVEFVEDEEIAEELPPLSGPKTYQLVLSRSIKLGGHKIEPGTIGSMTINHGLDPDWVFSMHARGISIQE